MEKPGDEHLTTEEIAALLDPRDAACLAAEREDHARSCENCKRVVEMHREEYARLKRLAGGARAGGGRRCPPATEWASLAAGLLAPERREALLEHATDCDSCGALLHAVMEDFSTDMSVTEPTELEGLKAATPEWQRAMARQMAEACRPAGWRAVLEWLRTAPPAWRWAASAAAVLVCAAAGWLAYDHWVLSHPSRLLAQAFTQQRPFEFRIPGAKQAPVRIEKRGLGSSFQRPPAVLEAEARIARKLAGDPDSPEWLTLRARAEMLAWDPEAAIATLNRALEGKPEDPALLADLGMAYALRAEAQDRAVDYGQAIEQLSRALKAKPNFPEAIFNRAVVYERMYLFEEALKEWRHYLDLDPRGGWAEEARRRLADIEQKKKVRQDALNKISDDPAKLLRRIEQGEEVEPEPYLDIAVMEWLPRRWDDAKYEQALKALAGLFEGRHRDRWLSDVLRCPHTERHVRGLAVLAAVIKGNLTDDTEKALELAVEAERHLKAAGDRAGTLRATWEHTYALQLAYRAPQCMEQAAEVERQAMGMRYSWIAGQARLELGICRNVLGDSGGARQDMERALEQIRQAGYRVLELRAGGTWRAPRRPLATCWSHGMRVVKGSRHSGLGRILEIAPIKSTSICSALLRASNCDRPHMYSARPR